MFGLTCSINISFLIPLLTLLKNVIVKNKAKWNIFIAALFIVFFLEVIEITLICFSILLRNVYCITDH